MFQLTERVEMDGVDELFEEYPVDLVVAEDEESGDSKILIYAVNDSGRNGVAIDLLSLLSWVQEYMPNLYDSIKEKNAIQQEATPATNQLSS